MIAVVMLVMIIILIFLNIILNHLVRSALERHLTYNVLGIAASAARSIEIDLDRYIEFIDTRDIKSDYYIEKNDYLTSVKESGKLAYIYTLKLLDCGTMFEYILDAEPINSEYWSAPGDVDDWDDGKKLVYDQIVDGIYKGAPAISPGTIDLSEWGELIVAYAPLLNADGEIVGILGADIDGAYLYTLLAHFQITLGIVCIILLLVVWLLIKYYSGTLREAQERLSLMLDTSPLCTQIWAKDLSTIDCNEAGVRLTGSRIRKNIPRDS